MGDIQFLVELAKCLASSDASPKEVILKRKLPYLTLVVSMLVACTACVPLVITQVNRASNERATERRKILLDEHLKLIERLRTEGDPMGEYLWVRANADRLISNPIGDPLLLKDMYEKAAEKGSIDAQQVLGLMLFSGSSTPSGFCTDCSVLKRENRNPELGLKLIEKAMEKQCFYWSVEIDGMTNQQCLTPVVAAIDIWPNFRDGTVVPQNTEQAERWRKMTTDCQMKIKKLSPQFFSQQKFPACR